VDIEEAFPADNETLRVTPMVMSGSHYPILSLPSKEMEEETMKKDEESFHVPGNMTTTLGMDEIHSNLFVHDNGVEHSSLGLTEEIQKYLLWVTTINHSTNCLPKKILEPSYYENSCDLLLYLSTKNECGCALDNVLDWKHVWTT
jgi:hypothetical protein